MSKLNRIETEYMDSFTNRRKISKELTTSGKEIANRVDCHYLGSFIHSSGELKDDEIHIKSGWLQ